VVHAEPAGRADRNFLDDLEARLAPLDRKILLAEWRQAVGRPTDLAPIQTARGRLLGPPEILERVRRARAQSGPGTFDRRLELLERVVLQCRIEQAPEIVARRVPLERREARFRPRWHGRRVGRAVVRKALGLDPDRAERERAYRAEEPLYRPMEDDLRTLVGVRNARARALGFRSYPDYHLRFEGLTVARMRELIEDALRYARPEMRGRRAAFEDLTHERGWYPWDFWYTERRTGRIPDAVFPRRALLAEVTSSVRKWGFGPAALRFRVNRHDISSGGLCLAPDPPRDVRIVIHPSSSWGLTMALFHEVGHAISSRSIHQPSSHLLRWHEHVPGFAGHSEGQGRFFEQVPISESWLRSRPWISPADIEAGVRTARRRPLGQIATLATWVLPELELYEHPNRDPYDGIRRVHRDIFGYDDFDPRSFADGFSIGAPCYSLSYVIAELLWPIHKRAVLEAVGGELWPNPKVGPWFVEHWFREGSGYDWWTRLREITGRGFDARAFNAEMRAVTG
jgi:hypothetical protein